MGLLQLLDPPFMRLQGCLRGRHTLADFRKRRFEVPNCISWFSKPFVDDAVEGGYSGNDVTLSSDGVSRGVGASFSNATLYNTA